MLLSTPEKTRLAKRIYCHLVVALCLLGATFLFSLHNTRWILFLFPPLLLYILIFSLTLSFKIARIDANLTKRGIYTVFWADLAICSASYRSMLVLDTRLLRFYHAFCVPGGYWFVYVGSDAYGIEKNLLRTAPPSPSDAATLPKRSFFLPVKCITSTYFSQKPVLYMQMNCYGSFVMKAHKKTYRFRLLQPNLTHCQFAAFFDLTSVPNEADTPMPRVKDHTDLAYQDWLAAHQRDKFLPWSTAGWIFVYIVSFLSLWISPLNMIGPPFCENSHLMLIPLFTSVVCILLAVCLPVYFSMDVALNWEIKTNVFRRRRSMFFPLALCCLSLCLAAFIEFNVLAFFPLFVACVLLASVVTFLLYLVNRSHSKQAYCSCICTFFLLLILGAGPILQCNYQADRHPITTTRAMVTDVGPSTIDVVITSPEYWQLDNLRVTSSNLDEIGYGRWARLNFYSGALGIPMVEITPYHDAEPSTVAQ